MTKPSYTTFQDGDYSMHLKHEINDEIQFNKKSVHLQGLYIYYMHTDYSNYTLASP